MSEKNRRPAAPDGDEYWQDWADRAEGDDISTPASARRYEGDAAEEEIGGLLDEILSPDELASIGRRGRPGLNGGAGSGESPKRQVRLPRELDAALTERAAAEHRRPSAIIRDALSDYLHRKAS